MNPYTEELKYCKFGYLKRGRARANDMYLLNKSISVAYNYKSVCLQLKFYWKQMSLLLAFLLGLYQVRLHEREEFLVSLHGAGKGQLEITGVSPSGETVPVDLQLSESEPDTYIVNYTPSEIGEHKIYVKFAGVNVRGSPFVVKVADPSKVLVQMSSLTEAQNAMMVGKEVVIPLEILPGAGEGELEADITGPGDVAVESSFTRQADTLYHFRFIPPVAGEYVIKMFYGGGLVGGHALNAHVKDAYMRADASKCVVYGEGMKECKLDFGFTLF